MASYTAGIIGSYVRDAVTPTLFDISGGNIYISGTLTQSGGGGTSNLVVPGYIRNALTPTTLDISGGNISNSGTTRSANALISGYIRDALTPTLFDISGGNISNSGTTTSANALVSGYLRNALTATQFDISGGNISNSNTISTLDLRVRSAGTVAAPALTIASDLSTGLYSTGANSFAISVAGIKTANFSNNFIEFSNSGGQTLWMTNNQLLANSGSVSVPSYAFAVDATTGMYRAGSGQIGFANLGVQRMTILSSGNVGIGVASPAYTLDVNGTTETTDAIVTGYLRNALTPTTLDISGGNIRNFGTIQSGTGYTLGIDASDTITGFSNLRTHIGAFIGVDESQYLSNGAEWPLVCTHTFSNGLWTFKTGNTTGGLIFKTRIAGTTAERMRIDSSANLGIGTSNAAARLHLVGVSNDASHGVLCIENTQAEDANVGSSLSFKARYHSTLSVDRVIFGKIDALKEDAANYSDTFMAFSTRFDTNRPTGGNGELRERMRLTSGGRLGVGTTAPAYRLDVSEAASNASINMSTWPRFSISNVGFTRGVTALRGSVVQWNTFSNSLNTNLLSITHSAVSGTYFQILKPGIWSIDWQLANNALGAIETYLDVCTSLASTAYAAIPSMGSIVKYMRSESFVMGACYVGYLESNASTYYRIWTNAGAISNNNYSQLRIAYLGETDSNAIFPP